MDPIMTIIIAIVTLIIGAAVGYFLSKKSVDKQNQELIDEATRKAQNLINDAEKDGEAIKKEKIFPKKLLTNRKKVIYYNCKRKEI